jgi:hypothetical protein
MSKLTKKENKLLRVKLLKDMIEMSQNSPFEENREAALKAVYYHLDLMELDIEMECA